MFKANEILYQSNEWISIVFLVVLVLLASAKYLYNERLSYLNVYFLSKNYSLLYFSKDRAILPDGFQLMLFVVQLLALGLFGYYVNDFFEIAPDLIGLNGYLTVVLWMGLYLIGRSLIGLALALLFDLREIQSKIAFEKTNYINNIALWLLPLLVLLTYLNNYSDLLIKTTVIFVLLLLICRYVLLFLSNKKLVYNDLFYFILYLCALEIAPLIIIIKLTI